MLFCLIYLASSFMKIFKLLIVLITFLPFSIHSQEGHIKSIWLDNNDINKMSIPELYLAKETIYAKHNYAFTSDSSKIYFSQFDWYTPMYRNSLIVLSEAEEFAIALINDRIENLLSEKSYISKELATKSKIDKYKNLTPKEKGHIGLFTYSISDAFEYEDRAGQHAIFLGVTPHNPFSKKQDRAVFNNVIKAVYCTIEDGYLTKQIEIEDLINPHSSLFDIRFMPQYISFDDIDQDGLVDPIITYTTMGKDGYRNGRTKINLLYKKTIISIDIQSSTKEEYLLINTNTRFHFLPEQIKQKLINLVAQMKNDGVCTLDDNWQTHFKNPFR